MPLRSACHATALLSAVLVFSGSTALVQQGVVRVEHGSGSPAARDTPELVSVDYRPGVALIPSWTPETAVQPLRILRGIRHAGRTASTAHRFDPAAVVLPLFFRITPFANPEGAAAAAHTRAGACSSFATTMPPPLTV